MGNRLPAGFAPGCPEIEENHFPFQIGEGDLPAFEGVRSEIRSQNQGRLFLAAMGKQADRGQAKKENQIKCKGQPFQKTSLDKLISEGYFQRARHNLQVPHSKLTLSNSMSAGNQFADPRIPFADEEGW
jgi:hypothetical protein